MLGLGRRRRPAPASIRAQLLATEHWSLLATRSMIQGEVLTRISIFLTVVSAVLVTLALVGQATGFGEPFALVVILLLGFALVIGTLTLFRVVNASMDDLMMVLAMNRLRAAYVEIDPGIGPYLAVSPFDDLAGADETYYPFGRRPARTHVAASSGIFIAAVDAAIAGLLAAAIAWIAAAGTAVTVGVGLVAGIVYLVVAMWLAYREYLAFWRDYSPSRAHPEITAAGTPAPRGPSDDRTRSPRGRAWRRSM